MALTVLVGMTFTCTVAVALHPKVLLPLTEKTVEAATVVGTVCPGGSPVQLYVSAPRAFSVVMLPSHISDGAAVAVTVGLGSTTRATCSLTKQLSLSPVTV